MGLRSEFSLGHSEFNDFLFAIVGEEKNGTALTVLSAIARVGLDPWREADRLTKLPREAASRALAATIATLPEGDWKVSDARSIAIRLLDRLPSRSTASTPPPHNNSDKDRKARSLTAYWLVGILLIAGLIVLMSRPDPDSASRPTPNSVSTTHR